MFHEFIESPDTQTKIIKRRFNNHGQHGQWDAVLGMEEVKRQFIA